MASDEGDELEDLLGRYIDRLNDGERLEHSEEAGGRRYRDAERDEALDE